MDKMMPRQVGKSGLVVTPLGLGCGILSRAHISNDQATATINAAWDSGVRLYDTSAWYGVGRSERRLGLALAYVGGSDRSLDRDSVTAHRPLQAPALLAAAPSPRIGRCPD